VEAINNGSISDTRSLQVVVGPADVTNFFEYREVWTSIAPLSGAAGGGYAVSIHGLGFDSAATLDEISFAHSPRQTIEREYRVKLSSNASAEQQLLSAPCQVLSRLELRCPVGTWTWKAGAVRVSVQRRFLRLEGVLQRRITRDLVAYNSDQNDTVSGDIFYDWKSQITSAEPTVGDKLGGTVVTILGHGFQDGTSYACRFHSRQGADGLNVSARVVSSRMVVCGATDVWSYATWSRNFNETVDILLLEGGKPVGSNSSAVQLEFRFVYINKAPTFAGRNLVVLSHVRNFSGAWLVGDAQPGLWNGTTAPDEDTQSLTFVVDAAPTSFFLTLPHVEGGNLTFQLSDQAKGVASVTVYVKDNGGNAFGGSNVSKTQTYTINIIPAASSPDFIILPHVAVDENSGFTEVLGFIGSISAPYNLLVVPMLSTSIVIGDNIFDVQPSIFINGSLSFAPSRFAHGNITVQVSLRTSQDPAAERVRSHNFTIEVRPINQPPTCLMKTRMLTFNESAGLTANNGSAGGATKQAVLAYNVTRGSVLDSILGQDQFEKDQELTFSVVLTHGNPAIFASIPNGGGPHVNASGNASVAASSPKVSVVYRSAERQADIILELAPFMWGAASFNLTLRDSGGRERGGWDTARTEAFAVEVLSVNSAPSFELSNQTIELLETSQIGKFSITGLANNILRGPAGYHDEDAQLLSFEVVTVDESSCSVAGLPCSKSLLYRTWPAWLGGLGAGDNDVVVNLTAARSAVKAEAAISADGMLSFHVRPYEYGSRNFTVTLHDSGGRERGGVDRSISRSFRITVLPVNNQPSFTLRPGLSSCQDKAGFVDSSGAGCDGYVANQLSWCPQAETFKNADGVHAGIACCVCGGGYAASPTRTLLESSGNFTEAGFAFSIFRGSPTGNEDFQDVTFLVEVLQGSAALFQPRTWGCNQSSLVAICADGTLNLQLAQSMHGSADLSVRLRDSGGTANGGVDTSIVHTFTITVLPVNNGPSFTARNWTVWENFDNASGAHSIREFATNISMGSMLEAGQHATFTVDVPRRYHCLFARRGDTAEHGGLPAMSSNGTLTFELAALIHGSFEMSVTLRDDGGRERGGVDTSDTKVFLVTILPVNNQPALSLDKEEIVVHEGDGNVSVSGVVSAMSAGPSRGGENAQRLHLAVELASGNESTFLLRHWRCPLHPTPPLPMTPTPRPGLSNNSNTTFCPDDELLPLASLFNDENYADLARWRLCSNGDFLFELVPYAHGEASFKITLSDSGGTDRGGVNVSVPHVLRVIVLPVNSRPSFTAPAQVKVLEDSGNYSQSFINSIFRGSPTGDEDPQTVTFSAVFVNGSTALFVPRRWTCLGSGFAQDGIDDPVLVRICPDRRLMFEVAKDANGDAFFTVTMQDSGGRERGGIDMSESHALRIIVSPVNDEPKFQLLPVIQVWERKNAAQYDIPDVAYDVSAGPANELHQAVSFSVVLAPGSTFSLFPQNCDPACLSECNTSSCIADCVLLYGTEGLKFQRCKMERCHQLSVHANGTLSFKVAPFVFGVADVHVTLHDNEGTGDGGVNTSAVHVMRIIVNSTNNVPSFKVTNVSLLEDQNDVSVNNFAHTILKNGDPCAPVNDEAAQRMSFAVFVQRGMQLFDRVGGFNASWLLGWNWTSLGELGLLSVTSDGVLSLKLAADQVGEALVAVVAHDDGGTQGGLGTDTSLVRYASVSVKAVNDAPSFELFQGDCFSSMPWCSNEVPTVMMPLNRFVDGNSYFKSYFARNVSTGPPDEMSQTYTFNVRKVSGQDIFVGVPTLHRSGVLNATQKEGVSGIALYNISVTDSGGNWSSGVDTSRERTVRFMTVGGSVEANLTLNVSAASLTPEFNNELVRLVAATIGYPYDQIGLSIPEAPGNSRRLLAVSVNVRVTIYATTSDPVQLATIARSLPSLSAISGVVAVGSGAVSLVDEAPIYAFVLKQSELTVSEDSGEHVQVFFATNVTASDAVDVDENGTRVVNFDVALVRSTEVTTGSELVSALFASPPVIESIPCKVLEPCGGTLKFTVRPQTFGEALFIVSMRKTDRTRSFSIRVQGVNDVPTFVIAKPLIVLNASHGANPRRIRVPGVLTNISAGAAEDSFQTVSVNVTVVSKSGPLHWPKSETWPSSPSPNSIYATRRRNLLSFSAAPGAPVVDDNLRLFFESLSFNVSDGTLVVALKPAVFGNITLGVQLHDSDGGVSTTHNLILEIEHVNHAPLFSVASAVVSILEDCAGTSAGRCENGTLSFVYENFVTNMSAGPANEGAQEVTIQDLVVVGCQVPFRAGGTWQTNTSNQALVSAGCPRDMSFPGVQAGFESLVSSPFVITPNGSLSVTLMADRHGAVRIAVSVSDNGGTARGGINTTTLEVLVHVVSVNDAPSVRFSPGLLNLTLNEGCREHVPERPYPTGWTWTQDAQACRSWRGIVFRGCWVPLYVCSYSPVWDEAPRVEGNASLLDCPASCSARVEGEVVLADSNMQVVIMNQDAFKLSVIEALKPISVVAGGVNLTSISNFTLPYQQPAMRGLLAHSEGVRVTFSIANVDSKKSNVATDSQSQCAQQCLNSTNSTCECLLPSCLQQCVASSLKELLESAYNASIFPTAAVTRLRVRPSDDHQKGSPVACVNPPPPPRVQCQDGRFVVHGHIFNISPGAWGEQNQQVWFTVQQRSGPNVGKLQIVLPLHNVTDQAVLFFEPSAERYGLINFYVTIHDSGGTTNGGVASTTYYSDAHPIEIQVRGFNRRPSFEIEDRLYVLQDSACVQAGDGLPCDASCQEGQSLCAGGALPGSQCGGQSSCAGNCSSGQLIPVSLSCTGTCSCDDFGNGVCSSPGMCRCDAPNFGSVCYSNADCTGGGSCRNQGTCIYPTDTGAPCTLSPQCSNRGKCVVRMTSYRRHQRYDLAHNISAGAPFEYWQGLSFTVTPDNDTLAAQLFARQPSGALVSMAADGMLAFNLTKGAFGSHAFTLQLSDDSGDDRTRLSETRRLTIFVNPTNSPPDFKIPENITVFEDSGAYDKVVVLDVFSPNALGSSMAVSFQLDTLQPQLFLPHGPPRIASTWSVTTRRLTFQVAPDMFGASKVVITMTDLSRQEAGVMKVTKEMLIIVQPVNDAPKFDLLRVFVSGPVNTPRQRIQVVTNITLGPANELCKQAGSWGCQYQKASFVVEDISHPFLFADFPSIDERSGDLVFRVAADTSGVSTVSIRLMDDGPLNDDAALATCADFPETAFFTDLTPVAPEYRGNGANVQCLRDSGVHRGWNTSKLVSIVIQVVHGPPIEEVRLLYNVNMTSTPSLQALTCPPLTLPYPALLDDAVLINDLGLEVEADLSHGGLLCSVLPGAKYDLGPGVERPNALLLLALGQRVAQISSFAVIVREGTYIPASVAAFRRHLNQNHDVDSPQGSASAASIEFLDRRQSPQRITRGLEYATALIQSPDRLHMYAIEPEIDSISVWNVHQKEPWESDGPVGVKRTVCKRGHECKGASSWTGFNDTGMSREEFVNINRTNATLGMQGWPDERSVSFVERRAHKEDRIRFRGMGSKEPLKFDRAPQAVYTPDMICHVEPFDNMPHGEGNETLQLLGMAGGCQDTILDHVLEANETHNYVTPTSQFQVLGRWDFSSASLYGDHYVDPEALDPFGSLQWAQYYSRDSLPAQWRCAAPGLPCQAAFEATGNVSCSPKRGCSYSRGSVQVPDCKEPATDLHIYPATIANSGGGTLGALIFTGPKCRSHATVHDWLLAPKPYNIINFLVNDGKHEAMQFDGYMNSGLFLTNDLRRFVNKDPSKSKLPSHEMAIEAWVTVDGQEAMTGGIMSAAVSSVGCSKGWRLFYELAKGESEAMDLKFKFEISLEGNDEEGTGNMKLIESNVAVGENFRSSCGEEMGLRQTGRASYNCFSGYWFHVMATYDGAGLYMQVSHQVDTDQLVTQRKVQKACQSPPCGAIIYPTDYHPLDGDPTRTCTTFGPVPVVVGNYTGREEQSKPKESFSHVGLIKLVALYKGYMAPEEADQHVCTDFSSRSATIAAVGRVARPSKACRI